MSHRQFLLVGMLMLCCVLSSVAQSPPQPRRVAFLVGINVYQKRQFKDLKWAEDDVNALAEQLRRLGFDEVVVMKGSDAANPPNRQRILARLTALLKTVTKNDIVLVGFSGHGEELTVKRPDGTLFDDGFICPFDAVPDDPTTMISLSFLTDELLAKLGGKNLVLVDACRDNPVENSKRGVRKRGVQGKVVALPEDTAMLFACRSRQVSEERDELKHSIFTYSVLEALNRTGSLTWSSLVAHVQERVLEISPDQEPISAGTIGFVNLRGKLVLKLDGTRAGEERDDNGLKMKFVWCPPGRFRMGSPVGESERGDNEGPVEVRLSRGFWLGQFEVTQGEWEKLMGTTIEAQALKGTYGQALAGVGARHPMYYVSHDEAVEFCRRLTDQERRAGRLPLGWEYRLPTESQWEYGCRSGTTTATWFGDLLSSEQANFDGAYPYNGGSKGRNLAGTSAVGSYARNAWGLYDMHGNVWEWCQDWYDEKLSGGEDPPGPSQATLRVFRGGGWDNDGRDCRSAFRGRSAPEDRSSDLGFRVARVSPR